MLLEQTGSYGQGFYFRRLVPYRLVLVLFHSVSFNRFYFLVAGDAAQYDDGYIKILGRLSADIIKSGGYKISALEIETHLLGHPLIADATVVGIPDHTWGQRVSRINPFLFTSYSTLFYLQVAAALVLKDPKGKPLDLVALKAWCKERMAPYMVPTEWRFYENLPRNALGKVNTVEFVKTAFAPVPNSKL